MARLVPAVDPSEIDNPGERKIAQVLSDQLPDSTIVIHSFNWLRKTHSGKLLEHECDFVLVDSKSGILFIEVKGGIISYRQETDEWVRILPNGGIRTIKSPLDQVTKNMYGIIDLIRQSLKFEDLPFTYGFAVAFPDGRFQGTTPPNFSRELIIDATRLNKMKSAVSSIFHCFRRNHHRSLTKPEFQAVKRALFPHYDVVPISWREIERQEHMLHRLTEEQKNALDFLSMQRVALIEGGAGTGKTMLAIAKAQQLAADGFRVLLLCYNRPLKEWLSSNLSDEYDNIVVNNYHGFVHDACKRTGIEFKVPTDRTAQDFWHNEAPEKLMAACGMLSTEERFDAVIVDEGQDFRELWWISLESAFRDAQNKKCFYVFLDPKQNLYVTDLELPDEFRERRFPLLANCRNTIQIASHCANIIGTQTHTKPFSPRGEEPVVLQVETVAQALDEVSRKVKELCTSTSGNLRRSQVAVLAPRKTDESWPVQFGKGIPATRKIDNWRRNEGVLIASPYQFKGLESDVAIVLTKQIQGDERSTIENYVARSRAKHILIVVEIRELNTIITTKAVKNT